MTICWHVKYAISECYCFIHIYEKLPLYFLCLANPAPNSLSLTRDDHKKPIRNLLVLFGMFSCSLPALDILWNHRKNGRACHDLLQLWSWISFWLVSQLTNWTWLLSSHLPPLSHAFFSAQVPDTVAGISWHLIINYLMIIWYNNSGSQDAGTYKGWNRNGQLFSFFLS